MISQKEQFAYKIHNNNPAFNKNIIVNLLHVCLIYIKLQNVGPKWTVQKLIEFKSKNQLKQSHITDKIVCWL